MLLTAQFDSSAPPSLKEVWDAQDKLWLQRSLLEIIAQEDKSDPLSDEDLVTKLQEAGYPVARRTVTKYRKMLNIQSSRQRKVWTS